MSIARDITAVGSATLLSRLLGFFRDVGIAAVLGAGPLSDAYFAALQIPNLFRRLLAEGALNSAFVPMWIRIREEAGSAGTRAFAEQILITLTLVMSAIALLCLVFAPIVVHLLAPGFAVSGERYQLTIEFVRLSVAYVAVVGVIGVAAAILNAERYVAAAAFGLAVFNGVLLAAVVLVVFIGHQTELAGRILSFAIFVAGLAQLALVGSAMMRLPQRPRSLALRLSREAQRFYARVVPGVVAGGIPQLKLMAGAMVASSSPAAVSWLYYANRLYELPLGVVSVAIASVIAPRIAVNVLAGERSAVAAEQGSAFEIALGLALPSAIAFAVLSTPIAGGLFERGAFGPRDTIAVAAALTAISAGLPGHVLEKVLGAISFAHSDTRTPMYAALTELAVAVLGALLLFPRYGHVGVAAAIAGSGWVGACILTVILLRRRWLTVEHGHWPRFAGIAFASAIMGIAIGGAQHLIVGNLELASSAIRIIVLALLVSAGLAVYLMSLQALGIARLRSLIAAVTTRP